MLSRNEGRPPKKRPLVNPFIALAILLSVLVLSFGDLMEVIPLFAPLVASSPFPFFHEIHDLLAIGIVLYAAYKYSARLGVAAILIYLAAHIPYAIIETTEEAPELLRIVTIGLIALFGVWLIARLHKVEETLHITEAQARTTLNNMLEGCQIIGFDWRYLYLNDSAAKQGQRTKEELLGHTMMEMYPGIEDTEMFASLRRCMDTHLSYRMENLFTFSDGSQRWFELSMEPVSEGVFILSLDITERKQAEREINLLSTIITRVAGESQSFDEAIEFTLLEVCKSTEWNFGEAWLPSRDGKVLECSPVWYSKSNRLEEFRQISKELTFLPNQGLPGRIWASKQSEWVSEISRQPELIFKRAQDALKAGLNTGVGVPVIANGLVVAVLIFFMSKFREEDGQLLRVVSSVVAQLGLVFQHSRAEEEVRRAAKEWQTTFDSVSEWVSVHDEDFKFIRVNKAFADFMKMKPEEIIGRHCYEVIHGEKEASQYCSHKVVIETGKPAHSEFFNPHLGIYMEVDAAPIFDESGEITATVHIGRDITERKRFENELATREKQLSLVFDNVWDVIFALSVELDDCYRFVMVNRKFVEVTGLSENQVVGKRVEEVIPEPAHALVLGKYKEAIQTRQPVHWEEISIYPTGKKVGEVTVAPMFDANGNCTQLIGTVHDVTEQRQLQEHMMTQDRLASIGQLASGIAHELNNPLTGVIGFSELLLEKDVPQDVKEDLIIINKEAKRTASVVRGLLTFARKQGTEKEPVDINSVIQGVLQLRSYEQKVSNIEVGTRFASDLPKVTGNGAHLQQVFINLIVNAEQAMLEAHNRGRFTITTERTGTMIRISIADDGPGISPENMMKLFTPFFTTKELGKGTGLGLSICHGIVTEHGGKIYAESELGKGATFVVELPISK